jgi:hypothetical protein
MKFSVYPYSYITDREVAVCLAKLTKKLRSGLFGHFDLLTDAQFREIHALIELDDLLVIELEGFGDFPRVVAFFDRVEVPIAARGRGAAVGIATTGAAGFAAGAPFEGTPAGNFRTSPIFRFFGSLISFALSRSSSLMPCFFAMVQGLSPDWTV